MRPSRSIPLLVGVLFGGVLLANITATGFPTPTQTPAAYPALLAPPAPAFSQLRGAPVTPPPAPAPAPAPRRPAVQPTPAPTGRGGLNIFVTDLAGKPLGDIRVQAFGPTERSGTTDSNGQLRITGVQAGTYRIRFSSDGVTDFEKEVVVRGGPNVDVDVSLRPAPPPIVVTEPAPPPPAPEPVTAPVGPVGDPQTLNIQDMPNREFIRNEPRKETLLSCSGNSRATLVQMNEEQAPRLYDGADVTYYVVAGEGTVKLDSREIPVEATSFVSVPRGTRFSISRKGRRPLIMVMQLSGEPCEAAK